MNTLQKTCLGVENKMKKIIMLFCSVMLTNASLSAHAESTVSLKTTDGYEVGAQVSNYKYEEPGLMNNKGNKIGLTGTAAKNLGNDWYVVGDLRFAFGDVDYTGSGTKSGNPDRLWDMRAIGGKDFAVGSYVLSPYAGFGYRTLFNDFRGTTSTGAIGYRRNSEYLYLPLGVTHRFQTDSASRISTSLEYDHLISGTQKSYLSDAGFIDISNDQKSGFGIRISSAYEKKDWSVGIFYYYWDIEDSERYYISGGPGYSVEPKNKTDEYGIQVKYRF
jgi:hypothetical protein